MVTEGNTETGTYSINPDCSGSAISSDGSNQYNLFIVNSGMEFFAIFASQGSPQKSGPLRLAGIYTAGDRERAASSGGKIPQKPEPPTITKLDVAS